MLWHGLAKDTRKNYSIPQRSFEDFCVRRSQKPWPAQLDMLGEWCVAKASPNPLEPKMIKASTIENYLAALRAVHVDRQLDLEVFNSPWLHRIVAGIRRTEHSKPTKQAFPITSEVLSKITYVHPGTIGTSSFLQNVNFDTAAKVAFAGLFRIGELTCKNDELDPDTLRTKVQRGDVSFPLDNSYVTVRLRRSKADKEHRGVNIVMARTNTPACPVEALRFLFTVDPRSPSSPLFNIGHQPMTRDWLIRKLKSRLISQQIEPSLYSGHSFRRGAAQLASNNGLTNDEIMTLGRWTSDAFHRYFKRSLRNRFEINQRFRLKDTSFLTPLASPLPSPPPSVFGAALLYGGSLAAS